MDRHRVDAAPDPDLDSGLTSKQPHADFTPSLHMLENREMFYYYSQQCQFLMFFCSKMCHSFKYYGQNIEIFHEKMKKIHVLGIDTDPDRPWVPIRIRQNDAEPTRSESGSTTQL